MTENEKTPLLGLTRDELRQVALEAGLPAFAGGQMARWLYRRHARTIAEMTDISADGRARLAERHTVGCREPAREQRSKDGTAKYLFPTRTGHYVETVYIPEQDRATLCVSSEVGCKMNCLFCQTGKQGYQGSLQAADILNQLYSLPERERITNIVYMGQGEPLDNLDEVLRSTRALTADWGWAWSPKRVTVSTVGLRAGLRRFVEESDCHLAVSLHAPTPEIRASLMPAERGMGIEEIVELLRGYDFAHQRRLSFEYIVFAGVNDSVAHAAQVVRLLRGLDCRVNLIRFHQIPGVGLRGVDDARMERLRDWLTAHGVFATIRASRGQDISAACGLLSTARQEELGAEG